MKTSLRQFFPGAALACFFTLMVAAFAQENPKPDNPAPKSDEKSAPAAAEAPAAPATPAASDVPSTPATAPTPSTAPASDDEKKDPTLRRIDTDDNATTPAPRTNRRRSGLRMNSGNSNDRVGIGQDVSVGKGEKAGDVVAIGGRATMEGESGDVVSILGGTRVTGPAKSVVAVVGDAYLNAKAQEVVAVLGNVELGPDADVSGDVVSVGGTVTRDPKAVVGGNVQNLGFGASLGRHADGLISWVRNCAMLGRPLGFGPHLGWAWIVALVFFAFYLLIALIFGGAVEKCAVTLETRPGYSLLAAVLTVLLTPVAIVLLCITIVGIAVVPFLVIGLLLASLFGKATMLAWIGRRFTKFFGDGPLGHVVFAVLIGGIIVLLLYTVPVVGFLTLKLLGWLGLGVVVYTIALGMKRDKPVAAVAAAGAVPMAASGFAPMPAVASTSGEGGLGGFATDPATGLPAASMAPAGAPVVPPVVVAATLPRAGFWIRIWALFIDVVLVAMVVGFSSGVLAAVARFFSEMTPQWSGLHFHASPPTLLPFLAIYGALMWKLRGTTIGGIVCGLKVVRLDSREVDWATAIVRALGCFLSLMVAGLGFIWIAIDNDKQSWHDKIAGTVVVHVPKGTPLV
jgi:uncharacterized RDD family membrane protein YckC